MIRFPAARERRQPIRTIFLGPFSPADVTPDGDGSLYVVDGDGNRVLVFRNLLP